MWPKKKIYVTLPSQFYHFVTKAFLEISTKLLHKIPLYGWSQSDEKVMEMWQVQISTHFLALHIWKFPPWKNFIIFDGKILMSEIDGFVNAANGTQAQKSQSGLAQLFSIVSDDKWRWSANPPSIQRIKGVRRALIVPTALYIEVWLQLQFVVRTMLRTPVRCSPLRITCDKSLNAASTWLKVLQIRRKKTVLAASGATENGGVAAWARCTHLSVGASDATILIKMALRTPHHLLHRFRELLM